MINHLPGKLEYLIIYVINKHKFPNIFNPCDYSEFIARDMLLNRNHKKALLADKYRARAIVEEKGYKNLLSKVYGTWVNAYDIDFDSLPEKFVLKCNHSCAMNIICTDKSKLDRKHVIETLNQWIKTKHPVYYESHYRKIKPLIYCEEYIDSNLNGLPIDYKFHCVYGKPLFVLCCYNRDSKFNASLKTYDLNWHRLPYLNAEVEDVHFDILKPKNLDKMIEYASALSKGFAHIRIDFYNVGNRVVFGEYTLTPQGGWLNYFTQETLDMIGDRIKSGGNGKK